MSWPLLLLYFLVSVSELKGAPTSTSSSTVPSRVGYPLDPPLEEEMPLANLPTAQQTWNLAASLCQYIVTRDMVPNRGDPMSDPVRRFLVQLCKN